MSDTNKTTPRPSGCQCRLEPVDENAGPCDLCSEAALGPKDLGWRIVHCPLHVEAVNSYNPERDRLARELAELALVHDDNGESNEPRHEAGCAFWFTENQGKNIWDRHEKCSRHCGAYQRHKIARQLLMELCERS